MAKVHDSGYGHERRVKETVHVPGSHTHTGTAGETGSMEHFEKDYGEHHDGHFIRGSHHVDDGEQDELPPVAHDHMHPHLDGARNDGTLARSLKGVSMSDLEEGYVCLDKHNLKGDSAELNKVLDRD